LSVKPCQEEYWTSQHPIPCHLTNSFGWMGGRVGGSHISSCLSCIHCCFKFEAHFTVVTRNTRISVGRKYNRPTRLAALVEADKDRSRVYMYLKQAFWKTHGERRKQKCIAALLNRLDARHWSSTTPHQTPQACAFIRFQKSKRRSFGRDSKRKTVNRSQA